MIKIGGAVIGSHEPEWGFGWDESAGPVRLVATDEAEARILAHRAGGNVYQREVFMTEWEKVTSSAESS